MSGGWDIRLSPCDRCGRTPMDGIPRLVTLDGNYCRDCIAAIADELDRFQEQHNDPD